MTTFEWLSLIPIALGLIGTIIALMGWIMKLNKKIDKMFDAINKVALDVSDIHAIQGSLILSQKTALEALTGNINGNVEKAMKCLDNAEESYNVAIKRNMTHTCD